MIFNKTKDFDFAEAFAGLNPAESRSLSDRLRRVIQRETESFRATPGINLEMVAEKLPHFPKWERGDGPTPYVWADKPPGFRCAWSCAWSTRDVNNPDGYARYITHRDWFPGGPESMSTTEIEAELQDYIFQLLLSMRPFGGAGDEGLFAGAIDLSVSALLPDSMTVHAILNLFREGATQQHYIDKSNPPSHIMMAKYRPGW